MSILTTCSESPRWILGVKSFSSMFNLPISDVVLNNSLKVLGFLIFALLPKTIYKRFLLNDDQMRKLFG